MTIWPCALVLAPGRLKRDYDDGLVHARKAVELAPEDGQSFVTLALAEYRLGHWSESLAASRHSLALLDRRAPSAWFLMALAGWRKGDKDKARGWFNQAAASMREQPGKKSTARRLWTEATKVLGERSPDAAGAGSASSPR